MAFLISTCARLLRLFVGRQTSPSSSFETTSRILCLTDGGVSDMINLVPLLHALRRHHATAHITVACGPLGEPIALACPAVNDVMVLATSWNSWIAAWKNATALQEYDWVIVAKSGFDRRLALLARLTNASMRIGFEPASKSASDYFTNPIALPDPKKEQHQIETLLRLLAPLGLVRATAFSVDLSLHLPDSALTFAAEIREKPPFDSASRFMLINLSSTLPVKFREEDFITLAKRILNLSDYAIGLVASPADQAIAREIGICMASKRIASVETPGPLELAALMEKASFIVTPEGGASHLAAAMKRPALVLWSEGPFKKWHSRHEKHAFVHALAGEKNIPVDRVLDALQPFLALKNHDVDRSLEEFIKPGEYDPLED